MTEQAHREAIKMFPHMPKQVCPMCGIKKLIVFFYASEFYCSACRNGYKKNWERKFGKVRLA